MGCVFWEVRGNMPDSPTKDTGKGEISRVSAKPTDVSALNMQALVRHLRDNPAAAMRDPAELAAEFEVGLDFVQGMLRHIHASSRSRESNELPNWSLRPILERFRSLCRRVTEQPSLFVGITTLLAIIAFFLFNGFDLNVLATSSAKQSREGVTIRVGGDIVLLFFGTALLHCLVYFRHGQARYALYGALTSWLIVTPITMVVWWYPHQSDPTVRALAAQLLIAFVFFFVAVMYSGLGVTVSMLGALSRMRKEDKAEAALSRQELLQRLFELEAKLSYRKPFQPKRSAQSWYRWVVIYRRHPWLWTAVLSMAITSIGILITGAIFHNSVLPPQITGILVDISEFGVTVVSVLAIVGISFAAKRVWLALAHTWLFYFCAIPLAAIPFGPFGQKAFDQATSPLAILVNIVLVSLVAVLSAVGATIEDREARRRYLAEDDPSAIAAELVRIQWRLAVHENFVCVLSVDAAKSSEMKAGADPIAVEYSFREYQSLISDICVEIGGKIHSTAGDGAIAVFTTVDDALLAAKRIQARIEWFNRGVNKLARPFRLRVGLHAGPVSGELQSVQFSEVIDIAAHVEAAAPVGGIAVTDTVAVALEGEALIPLKEPVDSRQVFLVLNSKEES